MHVESFDMHTPLASTDKRGNDVLAINRLWQQIGSDNTESLAGDAEELRRLMDGLDYFVLRPETTAGLIGAISVMDCGRGLAKIDSVAVHPEYRRNGYARQLAVRALDHCGDMGVETVMVTAMPSSQRLFASLNFEVYEKYDSGNATMYRDL